MDKKEIDKMIMNKLEANYNAYMRQLREQPAGCLIERAEEITAAKLVFKELCKGGYSTEHMEYLLRFQNPLEVVRDQWMDGPNLPIDEDLTHVLWMLSDKRDAEQDYALDEAFLPPERGVRMC